MADELPQQHRNSFVDAEEALRDVLAQLGLMEAITHRQTSPEREARALPLSVAPQDVPYVRLLNPISSDRTVMRRSLMVSVLEVLERNSRLRERLAFFEIGPVFLPAPGQSLPAEPQHLAIALTGLRLESSWDRPVKDSFDFYDLKGVLEEAMSGLHLENVGVAPGEHPSFHPGKCAYLLVDGRTAGVFGELHPLVKERFDFGAAPVLAAELDLNVVLPLVQERYHVSPVASFPPVLEDIAVIVDEDLPAGRLEEVIRQAGGEMLAGLRLFDVFRGPQIGEGKKSMAYGLTYQSAERTLTDSDALQIRQRIIRRLEQDLGAKLRS
jgi:phenylalanyl-tRNA synthetase beta chain